MISGAIGIVVGFVVFKTTATPVFLDVIITAVITVVGSLIGIAITKPDIPA
jgi:hypothetical protein